MATGDDPGGEPSRSPPGPGILSRQHYCEMNVWVEFWFGFDPLPTAAWPLALPTLLTALMVVVISLPEPGAAPSLALPPRFWSSTPRTSPLFTMLLLPFPMFATPRFCPPMLMPPSAH